MYSITSISRISRFCLTIATVLLFSSQLLGQGGGTLPPGGNSGGGTPGNPGTQPPGGPGGNQAPGGQGGGGAGGGGGRQAGGPQEFSADLNLGQIPVEIEDMRNSGFVGPTSVSIQETGFVGANSLSLSGGRSGTGRRVTNQGGSGLVGFPGGGAGGAMGNQLTFQVNRSPLRSPLINLISAPIKPASDVEARLLERIRRNPRIPQKGYRLSVEGRNVTLTGSLSAEDSDRLIRQLRLEPNVDNIIDQLQKD